MVCCKEPKSQHLNPTPSLNDAVDVGNRSLATFTRHELLVSKHRFIIDDPVDEILTSVHASRFHTFLRLSLAQRLCDVRCRFSSPNCTAPSPAQVSAHIVHQKSAVLICTSRNRSQDHAFASAALHLPVGSCLCQARSFLCPSSSLHISSCPQQTMSILFAVKKQSSPLKPLPFPLKALTSDS